MDEILSVQESNYLTDSFERPQQNTSDQTGSSSIVMPSSSSGNLLLALPHIPMVWLDEMLQVDGRYMDGTQANDIELKNSITRIFDIAVITLAAPFVLLEP
jgi:hypothetical protein